MTLVPERVEEYFATARRRHQIYLDRRAGKPWPWTDDPILRDWRFTNVFRELDKTTVWIREHVREPLRDKPEVMLAMVLCRTLNRIESLEAVFCQTELFGQGHTAWEIYLRTGDVGDLAWAIRCVVGARGPYVTGAYIVKTPDNMLKLDGALWIVDTFRKRRCINEHDVPEEEWSLVAETMGGATLQSTHQWFTRFPFFGGFTAYEVVSDLRHTDLLSRAPDIMTWANAGPGCSRGLNYLHGRDWQAPVSQDQLCDEMRQLLAMSQSFEYWPYLSDDWPAWEMREVEHWCCEYLKYARMRETGKTPKQRFRP